MNKYCTNPVIQWLESVEEEVRRHVTLSDEGLLSYRQKKVGCTNQNWMMLRKRGRKGRKEKVGR